MGFQFHFGSGRRLASRSASEARRVHPGGVDEPASASKKRVVAGAVTQCCARVALGVEQHVAQLQAAGGPGEGRRPAGRIRPGSRRRSGRRPRGLGLLQHGHLALARRAPGRPQVHHCLPALERELTDRRAVGGGSASCGMHRRPSPGRQKRQGGCEPEVGRCRLPRIAVCAAPRAARARRPGIRKCRTDPDRRTPAAVADVEHGQRRFQVASWNCTTKASRAATSPTSSVRRMCRSTSAGVCVPATAPADVVGEQVRRGAREQGAGTGPAARARGFCVTIRCSPSGGAPRSASARTADQPLVAPLPRPWAAHTA